MLILFIETKRLREMNKLLFHETECSVKAKKLALF